MIGEPLRDHDLGERLGARDELLVAREDVGTDPEVRAARVDDDAFVGERIGQMSSLRMADDDERAMRFAAAERLDAARREELAQPLLLPQRMRSNAVGAALANQPMSSVVTRASITAGATYRKHAPGPPRRYL